MGRPAALLEPVASLPRLSPPLENGEHLTRVEFERRYEAMPHGVRAELVEGVVHMQSPVRADVHGRQTSRLITWLGVYSASTPGSEVCDNTTVRLDMDNEHQPDAFLRVTPGFGGQSRTSDGYVEGAPELVVEVAASTTGIDLHEKMNAYRRNGVREYLVWRVRDGELDYFVWREGRYERLNPDASGIHRSEVFPGLWLDAPALLRGDMPAVLRALQDGLASAEHAEFVAGLARAAAPAEG